MPKKQARKPNAGVSINGSVDTGGGDIAGGNIKKGDVYQSHGLQASDIKEMFAPIYPLIDQKEALPPEDREDLKAMVGEIEAEAAKGEAANETLIGRHLRTIARMAPDILDITLKTIANPVLGLAAIAQKIASKANTEEPQQEPAVKKKGLTN